jgi:hypothetical protein
MRSQISGVMRFEGFEHNISPNRMNPNNLLFHADSEVGKKRNIGTAFFSARSVPPCEIMSFVSRGSCLLTPDFWLLSY